MPLALDLSFSSGMLVWLLIFFIPFVAMGFAVGRWWVLVPVVAAGVAVVVFLVVNDGIYGQGWGEGDAVFWIAGPAALVLGGASAGLLLRRGWETRR